MNTNKAYNLAVVVGRMQPYHLGHKYLIEKSLSLADNVLLFIGHSGWTDHRHFVDINTVKDLIQEDFKNIDNLYIRNIFDKHSDSSWALDLALQVDMATKCNKLDKENICFVGSKKDVNWYCNLLPSWDLIMLPQYKNINATDIRKKYFCSNKPFADEIPEVTNKFLLDFANTMEYTSISTQYKSYFGG